ncbi:MAG: hypothetical protein HOO96_05665 [Polyangiaceae bacterium]|nr:hypothetical protein [Polyangiaceae bacterium]
MRPPNLSLAPSERCHTATREVPELAPHLAIPPLAALFSVRPTLASMAFAWAAAGCLLAYAPTLRAAAERPPEKPAMRALGVLGAGIGLSVIAGTLATSGWLLPGAAVGVGAPCLFVCFAALRPASTWRKGLASLFALAATGVPVLLAGGAGLRAALAVCITWTLGLVAAWAATRSNRAIRRGGREPTGFYVWLATVAAMFFGALLTPVFLGALPMVTVAAALLVSEPRPPSRTTSSWGQVMAAVCQAALIQVLLR